MINPKPPVVIPPLPNNPPGLPFRMLALVLPGVRKIVGQIDPYTRFWSEQNNSALADAPPLLVVIGDSTAIGVGASSAEHGYVGCLRQALSERDNKPWQVVNLARSGAKVNDALSRQLPIAESLASLGLSTLTLCCIGSNDVLWNRSNPYLRDELLEVIGRLPTPSVLGLVAGGGVASRNANRSIRQAGARGGFDVVNPWQQPGQGRMGLAEDGFHPNDDGYLQMAQAFAKPLGAPVPAQPSKLG